MKLKSGMSNRRTTIREAGMAEYNAKRLQLTGIAADIFKHKGFQATSINEIAAAAGIDRATFYYYAASKKELFQDVVGEAVKDDVRQAEHIAKGPGTALEKLQNFVNSQIGSFDRHYPYLFVFIQEDMTKISSEDTEWAREMRALQKRFDEALTGIVQEGMDTGYFSLSNHARLTAFGIVGMLNWSHRWYKPGKDYTVAQISAAFSNMIISGLLARQPCVTD